MRYITRTCWDGFDILAIVEYLSHYWGFIKQLCWILDSDFFYIYIFYYSILRSVLHSRLLLWVTCYGHSSDHRSIHRKNFPLKSGNVEMLSLTLNITLQKLILQQGFRVYIAMDGFPIQESKDYLFCGSNKIICKKITYFVGQIVLLL